MTALSHAVQGSEAGSGRADVANTFIATVYFKQATDLLDRGQYAEAEGYLREVLCRWPDHLARSTTWAPPSGGRDELTRRKSTIDGRLAAGSR